MSFLFRSLLMAEAMRPKIPLTSIKNYVVLTYRVTESTQDHFILNKYLDTLKVYSVAEESSEGTFLDEITEDLKATGGYYTFIAPTSASSGVNKEIYIEFTENTPLNFTGRPGGETALRGLRKIYIPRGFETDIGPTYIDGLANCLSLVELEGLGPFGVGGGSTTEGAFNGCTNLTTVTLDGCAYIGKYAFAETGISEVTIPSGCSIEEQAFRDCPNLSSITLEGNHGSVIGDSAFCIGQGATGKARTLYLEGTITGHNSSNNDDALTRTFGNLTKVEISSTKVPASMFNEYASLTSVTLDNGLKEIEANAFSYCPISTISIPGSCTTIGDYSFLNCPLTNITIGAGNTLNLGIQSFYSESTNRRLDLNRNNIGFTNSGDTLLKVMPNLSFVKILESITAIQSSLFKNHTSLKTLNLESATNLESINSEAFSGCTSLTGNSSLPSKCTTIGSKAFYNCISLTSLDCTKVTTISDSAFNGCSSLESVVSLEACKEIGESAFQNCRSLREAVLTSVTSIGVNAFNGSDLTNLTGNYNIRFIGKNALSSTPWWGNHVSGTFVTLNNWVLGISGTSLSSGENLEGQGITKVAEYAFENKSVSSLGLGEYGEGSILYLGNGAFKNCETYSDDLSPFSSLDSIPDEAFMGTQVNMNGLGTSSVTSIGTSAFEGCKTITSIDLPSGLTSIGEKAFSNCVKVHTINAYCTKVPQLMGYSGDTHPFGTENERVGYEAGPTKTFSLMTNPLNSGYVDTEAKWRAVDGWAHVFDSTGCGFAFYNPNAGTTTPVNS